MPKIIDGKYKAKGFATKEEFSEEEYTALRKAHPEVEREISEANEAAEHVKYLGILEQRKQVILARGAEIIEVLKTVPISIIDEERRRALLVEGKVLKAELANINEILAQ